MAVGGRHRGSYFGRDVRAVGGVGGMGRDIGSSVGGVRRGVVRVVVEEDIGD
jgi:hypothetical protein